MSSYLVTGASRGIGLELVRQLASLPTSEVAVVFAVTRNPSTALDTLMRESSASAKGHQRVVNVIVTDLTDVTEVAKSAAEVKQHLSSQGLFGLDVLVNNAGVGRMTKDGKLENVAKADLEEVLRVNVVAPHVMMNGFLGLLREGKGKTILNISSKLGSLSKAKDFTWIPAHAYKVSKTALNMLTQQYALELKDEGFTVVVMDPGAGSPKSWLKTDMGSQNAHLEVSEGVDSIKRMLLSAGPQSNGKFLTVQVPGWENLEEPHKYDGGELAW